MAPALLLFDIDGTLVSTGGAGRRAMKAAGRAVFGPHFSFDHVHFAGHLDPLIFDEAARPHGLHADPRHHQTFHGRYIEELKLELARSPAGVVALPGVRPTLDLLRARAQARGDLVLGLLTGNYRAAAPLKLAAAGLDPAWFALGAFGDDGPAREDLVDVAVRRCEDRTGHRPHPQRVVVIGDTPRDVRCAKARGCVAFAVATGGYTVGMLRQAGADVAVPDLTDPRPLLEVLDR